MFDLAHAEQQGFTRPGTGSGLADVARHRYLLRLLVRKEVGVRYRGSVLGWLWSYVKPAAQFAVFFLALGIFLKMNTSMPSYPIYLFSGVCLTNFFTEAFSNATRSLVDNAALIKKIYLPREMFPVSSTLVALVNFLPQAAVLLIVCLIVGWHPSLLQFVGILLGIVLIALLAIGLGMLFGAANVVFRDSQNFVEIIVMVVAWLSPVLYPFTLVQQALPTWAFAVYQLNPITAAINLFHAGFWYPTTDGSVPLPPHLYLFASAATVICLIILGIGQVVFRKLEGRFAQDL